MKKILEYYEVPDPKSERWFNKEDLEFEEWRHIDNDEITGSYEVSNYGRVRFADSHIIKSLKRFHGYVLYQFTSNITHKKFTKTAHALVAEMFIGKMPDNCTMVDHINTKPFDNRPCNLRYTTASGNANNELSKLIKRLQTLNASYSYNKPVKLKISECANSNDILEEYAINSPRYMNVVDFKDEKWVRISLFNRPYYCVSNYGRVKSFINNTLCGEIMKQTITNGSYAHISVYSPKKDSIVAIPVHVLVYGAFAGIPDRTMIVNHRNSVRYDNRLCNLNLCKNQKENLNWKNTKELFSERLKNKKYNEERHYVIQKDYTSKEIMYVYDSVDELENISGINKSTLLYAINEEKEVCGFLFEYTDDEYENNCKPIHLLNQYEIDGTFIRQYKNIGEVFERYGYLDNIKNRLSFSVGYIWRYAENENDCENLKL